MRFKITLFFICYRLCCFAQSYDLKDFVLTTPPKPYSPEWYPLNTSGNNFSVEMVNGKLNVTKEKPAPIASITFPFGELWAINQGEFGGALYYKPNDSDQKSFNANGKTYTIDNHSAKFTYRHIFEKPNPLQDKLNRLQFELPYSSIKSFFRYRDSLYFITNHLDKIIEYYGGAIYRLDMKKDSVTITQVMKFDDAPAEILIDRDIIYLATSERFYVFNNWHKELELDDLFWRGLGLSQLVMDDKKILYTGLFGGYAKIDVKEKSVSLYKYVGPPIKK